MMDLLTLFSCASLLSFLVGGRPQSSTLDRIVALPLRTVKSNHPNTTFAHPAIVRSQHTVLNVEVMHRLRSTNND